MQYLYLTVEKNDTMFKLGISDGPEGRWKDNLIKLFNPSRSFLLEIPCSRAEVYFLEQSIHSRLRSRKWRVELNGSIEHYRMDGYETALGFLVQLNQLVPSSRILHATERRKLGPQASLPEDIEVTLRANVEFDYKAVTNFVKSLRVLDARSYSFKEENDGCSPGFVGNFVRNGASCSFVKIYRNSGNSSTLDAVHNLIKSISSSIRVFKHDSHLESTLYIDCQYILINDSISNHDLENCKKEIKSVFLTEMDDDLKRIDAADTEYGAKLLWEYCEGKRLVVSSMALSILEFSPMAVRPTELSIVRVEPEKAAVRLTFDERDFAVFLGRKNMIDEHFHTSTIDWTREIDNSLKQFLLKEQWSKRVDRNESDISRVHVLVIDESTSSIIIDLRYCAI